MTIQTLTPNEKGQIAAILETVQHVGDDEATADLRYGICIEGIFNYEDSQTLAYHIIHDLKRNF